MSIWSSYDMGPRADAAELCEHSWPGHHREVELFDVAHARGHTGNVRICVGWDSTELTPTEIRRLIDVLTGHLDELTRRAK